MRIALLPLQFADGEVQAGQLFDPAEVSYPASLPQMHYDAATMEAAVAQWRVLEQQLGRSVSLMEVLQGSAGVFGASYTPALTDTTNIDSSTLVGASWTRTGDRVTVNFEVTVDPTAAAATELQIALPLAQDMAAATELVGTAVGGAGTEALVDGDAATDAASVTYTAPGIGAETFRGSFSYLLTE
jgi:hypothetical protein